MKPALLSVVLCLLSITTPSLMCPPSMLADRSARTRRYLIIENGRRGFIDREGRVIIPPQYSWAGDFSDGLAQIRVHGKYGYIDPSGKVVIPPQFDWAGHFSEGLALVRQQDRYGYIGKSGSLVIPARFDWGWAFSEGLAKVLLSGRVGYVNEQGAMVIPPQFINPWQFHEGLATVKIRGKWGYINKTGRFVIPARYHWGWDFAEGLAMVQVGEKFGYINKSGGMAIQPQFDFATNFSEGLAAVGTEKGWGFIDEAGTVMIPERFQWASGFAEGLAGVKAHGLWGFIDRSKKMVIPARFDRVGHFAGGLAPVEINGRWGYINRHGDFVWRAAASAFSRAAVVDKTSLASTPPMGFNGFFVSTKVGDEAIREEADALVSTGLKAAGYKYLIVDDTWEGGRDSLGYLYPNGHFPDMKALVDYVHSKGLKFGIYSSPGRKTCAGFEGSFGYEEQDAGTFARWGVDYLKYDWCSGSGDQIRAYRRMDEALKKTGRPILFALCQYGWDRVWRWGASVGGNTWRTTSDIALHGISYDAIAEVGFEQNGLEQFAGPGHWNDPDALLVGEPGINQDEARTQMSLWCLLAAPLIASNDLTRATAKMLAILTNPEVIAIDQDPAGVQGRRVAEEGPLEVWEKPLADGSKAIGLFNRDGAPMPVTVRFRDVGLPDTVYLRDLWARKDLGIVRDHYTAIVPRHGVVMLKGKPAPRQAATSAADATRGVLSSAGSRVPLPSPARDPLWQALGRLPVGRTGLLAR